LWRRPAAAAARARRGPAEEAAAAVDDDGEGVDAADETIPAVATPAARALWPAQLIFAFVAPRSSAWEAQRRGGAEERMTKAGRREEEFFLFVWTI